MNTKVKNMNAITLIVLVITIVILIILATVVINLSLGDNGIFNRARTASQQYNNAQITEQDALNEINIESYRDTDIQSLINRISALETEVAELKERENNKASRFHAESFQDKSVPAKSGDTYGSLTIKDVTIEKDGLIYATFWTQSQGALDQQLSSQMQLFRNGTQIQQVWEGDCFPKSGAICISRIFTAKAGDVLRYRCFNWNTSAATIKNASIMWYEL